MIDCSHLTTQQQLGAAILLCLARISIRFGRHCADAPRRDRI